MAKRAAAGQRSQAASQPKSQAASQPTSQPASQPARAADPRSLRRSLVALRAGANGAGMLGGLACFVLLAQLGVQQVVAAVIGFGFALLGRVAAASLGREWLLRSARRHQASPPGGTVARRRPR